MSTVADIFLGAKYDLRDYGFKEFDETQMIHFLNRCVVLLDRALMSLNSDQTLNEATLAVGSGDNYVAVPTGCLNVRTIYDADDTLITKIPAEMLYDYRLDRSTDTAQPVYWSYIQNQIEFEVTTDQAYNMTCYYDKATTPFTATADTIPYNGVYDDQLREVLVMMANGKKNAELRKADAVYLQMFTEVLHQDMINRNFIPKPYKLDF